MKKYIGTKQIEAEPMTMGEAYERGLLQAGKLPKDVEKNNAGYHVRYKDGYESWSPAEPFEEAYRVADTPLERMLIEGEDLTIKTEKLRFFIKSGKFDMFDIPMKALLQAQLRTMIDYQYLLNMRYAKIDNGDKHGFHYFPFSIALHLLKDGYKVRRYAWEKKYRISNCSNILFMDCGSDLSDFWYPSNNDIFAEDWEFFVDNEGKH